MNRAALAHPKIAVASGNNAYNWGEGASSGGLDATPDLVNSLFLSFSNVGAGADLRISLLAPVERLAEAVERMKRTIEKHHLG